MPFGNRLLYIQRDSPVHRDTTSTALKQSEAQKYLHNQPVVNNQKYSFV